MKLQKVLGATSEIWQIFIQDSSSTTGAGLTGLTNASSSLTAYYHRDTDTTATAISLVTMTVGTFTSSGFKEIDATNMPGWYQFCPPNAALASGAKSCAFHLKGATNMAPLPIEVQLTATNVDSATTFMTGVNGVAPPTNWNLFSIDGSGRVDITKILGTAISTPATAGILDVNVKNMNNVAATAITTIKAVQGLTTADTVTTATNLTTNNDKTGYSLAASQLFIKKNTALNNFEFVMTDSTTHAPKTGVTVTCTISIDGGAFGASTNSPVEVSSGVYKINLAAADVNGTVITLRFTGTNADDLLLTFITQT